MKIHCALKSMGFPQRESEDLQFLIIFEGGRKAPFGRAREYGCADFCIRKNRRTLYFFSTDMPVCAAIDCVCQWMALIPYYTRKGFRNR